MFLHNFSTFSLPLRELVAFGGASLGEPTAETSPKRSLVRQFLERREIIAF